MLTWSGMLSLNPESSCCLPLVSSKALTEAGISGRKGRGGEEKAQEEDKEVEETEISKQLPQPAGPALVP